MWCSFQIYCLNVLRGQRGEILLIIFQRNKASQKTLGPDTLLPCRNSFLLGSEQFHFLPELSTVNSNNSALCGTDSLVKPTEQNVTNRIPGKRGVAHRLKLTTSPQAANLHLSHGKDSEVKPNPWAKFIMPGKTGGGNKHLQSTATVSNSLLTPGPDRDCIQSHPSAWRGKPVFNAKFLSLSFFILSLRSALSSLRKQGLRVYTCDPNFPFCEIILKKNNSRELSEPVLFLRPMVTISDSTSFFFQIWPKLWLIIHQTSLLSKSLPRPSFLIYLERVNINS